MFEPKFRNIIVVSMVGAVCGAFALCVILSFNVLLHGGRMDRAGWLLFLITLMVYSSAFFVFAIVGVAFTSGVAKWWKSVSPDFTIGLSISAYCISITAVFLSFFGSWEMLFALGPAVIVLVVVLFLGMTKRFGVENRLR